MTYKNKLLFSKRKAFTLIELLIVIAIIGILFVVLVSKVDFATNKTKATGVQTDFRSFQVAIESVAKEHAGLATFGWDTGDTNGNRIRDSYDKGDTNKNGKQDPGEVFVGSKAYAETWNGIYTLTNPADANDKSAITTLESAINNNLDPKLHITINDDYTITMANGAKDPWNTEYHGYYITNAVNDNKDRGAIIMYSNGANQEFGSEHSIANGVVTVNVPGNNVYGKDDYSIAIVYTYFNGYGEVKTTTTGFSNNQGGGQAGPDGSFIPGNGVSGETPGGSEQPGGEIPGGGEQPDDEDLSQPGKPEEIVDYLLELEENKHAFVYLSNSLSQIELLKFVPTETGRYILYTDNELSYGTTIKLLDRELNTLANANEMSTNDTVRLTYTFETGQPYYIELSTRDSSHQISISICKEMSNNLTCDHIDDNYDEICDLCDSFMCCNAHYDILDKSEYRVFDMKCDACNAIMCSSEIGKGHFDGNPQYNVPYKNTTIWSYAYEIYNGNGLSLYHYCTDDGYCDGCGISMCTLGVTHVDSWMFTGVADGLCDTCGYVVCDKHFCVYNIEDRYVNCDTCYHPAPLCPDHFDYNNDEICDACGYSSKCALHYDDDYDNICNNCYYTYCCNHHDRGDNVCDACGNQVCQWHDDYDGDNICEYCYNPICLNHQSSTGMNTCDNCGELICPYHYNNGNGYCDYCSKEFIIPGNGRWCVDKDYNGYCDYCNKYLINCTHDDYDGDGYCDYCNEFPDCHPWHVDYNYDNVCDACDATLNNACSYHYDNNNDYICDSCNAAGECPGSRKEHVNDDFDYYCDKCGFYFNDPWCSHNDSDGNYICDDCSDPFNCLPWHVESNEDEKCDYCGEDLSTDYDCGYHVDYDNNGYCDSCYIHKGCKNH